MSRSQESVHAVVVRAGEGEQVAAAGVEHRFLLTSGLGGGRLGVEEFIVPSATLGPRPHVHHSHDETFYVLSGELTVATSAGEIVLGAGDLAQAARGALHGYRNAHPRTAVRALCLYTPPGYEQYFRDVHAAVEAGTEITDVLLSELRSRYDTESR